ARADTSARPVERESHAHPSVRTSALPLGAHQANRFAGLVARHDTGPAFLAFAVAVALMLGAAHAFAPGHGKTVMAAYLVGERGSLRHAFVLGGTVAATHTIGVLTLGFVLAATQAFAPVRLYPWFGVASGICFAALGATLL